MPARYPHIALLEAGLPYELVKVDMRAKKLENGEDYLKLNPKGQVPALGLDSGEIVTEGPVIVQMIVGRLQGPRRGAAAGTGSAEEGGPRAGEVRPILHGYIDEEPDPGSGSFALCRLLEPASSDATFRRIVGVKNNLALSKEMSSHTL